MNRKLADVSMTPIHPVDATGWSHLIRGYDRRSLMALSGLMGVFALVGFTWSEYLYLVKGDTLLHVIWMFMTCLLCWGIAPKRDGIRLCVGIVAGLVIESWGTVTGMWHYFTAERPPIWILPAWPVATIAIDRLARMLELIVPEGEHRWVWYLLLPPFCILFMVFSWPYIWHPASWFFLGAMWLILASRSPDRRQDVMLMIAGAGLGYCLEYWGTSRNCWTYYTNEVPPFAAALAHGFAAVTIQRVAGIIAPDVAQMRSSLHG